VEGAGTAGLILVGMARGLLGMHELWEGHRV
jgi:hypothetical protein